MPDQSVAHPSPMPDRPVLVWLKQYRYSQPLEDRHRLPASQMRCVEHALAVDDRGCVIRSPCAVAPVFVTSPLLVPPDDKLVVMTTVEGRIDELYTYRKLLILFPKAGQTQVLADDRAKTVLILAVVALDLACTFTEGAAQGRGAAFLG